MNKKSIWNSKLYGRFNGISTLTVLLMLLAASDGVLAASISIDSLREYEIKFFPDTADTVKFFKEHPDEFRVKAEAALAARRELPRDAGGAKFLVDRDMRLMGEWVSMVYDHKPMQDQRFMEEVWKDQGATKGHRSTAAILLYLTTGDVNYVIRAIPIAPLRFRYLAKVRDDQFQVILRAVFAECAKEEVMLMGGNGNANRVYSLAVSMLYADLAEAIYFQKADEGFGRWLFERREYFQTGTQFWSIDVTKVVEQLRPISKSAVELFVSSLIKQATEGDPGVREVMERSGVVDHSSEESFVRLGSKFPELKMSTIPNAMQDHLDELVRRREVSEKLREYLNKKDGTAK